MLSRVLSRVATARGMARVSTPVAVAAQVWHSTAVQPQGPRECDVEGQEQGASSDTSPTWGLSWLPSGERSKLDMLEKQVAEAMKSALPRNSFSFANIELASKAMVDDAVRSVMKKQMDKFGFAEGSEDDISAALRARMNEATDEWKKVLSAPWLKYVSSEELQVLDKLRRAVESMSSVAGKQDEREPLPFLDILSFCRDLYNLREEALSMHPDLFDKEASLAGAISVRLEDAEMLWTWEPFARHAYDPDVRPWVESKQGWVLLHQVGSRHFTYLQHCCCTVVSSARSFVPILVV